MADDRAFLLPALALYALFVLYPIVQSARYSLYDWNGLEPLTEFVGLDNFRKAFDDPVFRGAIRHNGILIVLSLLLQIPFALALAVMLNQKLRGRAVMRTLFFAPYILSEVVTGVVWRQILRPSGLLDQTLESARCRRARAGVARQPRRRAVQPVLRHLVEVLRVPHGDPARRAAADSQRAQRSGSHRRRDAMADGSATSRCPCSDRHCACRSSCRSSAPSSSSTSSGSPPRVGRSTPRRRWRPTSSTRVPTRSVRLRKRGVDHHLRVLARRRAAVPAVRAAPRPSRDWSRWLTGRRSANRPVREARPPRAVYVFAFGVLAIVVIPLLFAVLGGFRTMPSS